MIKSYDVIIVMPIGPGCQRPFIEDTLDSFIFYTSCRYKIVLADDSQKGIGISLQEKYADIDVVSTERSMGKLCGLYMTLSIAYTHVLTNYRCGAILRMDTDALVIGPSPEKEAIKLFASNPNIGIAGQYPRDYHGKTWDISWPRSQLQRLLTTYRFFKRPRPHFKLRTRVHQAKLNGYALGESVFGGACFVNPVCLHELLAKGLLPDAIFRNVNLEEDHLFAILVKSIGYELGDLSSGNLPFGCAWQGLPASPRELQESGKKIIHSVRHWKEIQEAQIRTFFRHEREKQAEIRANKAITSEAGDHV